ncbi:hypothetical protein KAR91_20010 [Candidatus Pacearchaeota archaeon]|nr:hypothetical protein [Candidatus Pacearchaeota archaeon]
MNIDALKTELLAGHPVTGPYDVDDTIATSQLNAINRTLNRSSMSASEIYNAIDVTEWTNLTDAQRQEVWDILHLGTVNPFGLEAARFTTIFGGVDAETIKSLQTARKTDVSRAVELRLGHVRVGYVQQARV